MVRKTKTALRAAQYTNTDMNFVLLQLNTSLNTSNIWAKFYENRSYDFREITTNEQTNQPTNKHTGVITIAPRGGDDRSGDEGDAIAVYQVQEL